MAKQSAVRKSQRSERAGKSRVMKVVRGLAAVSGQSQTDRLIHDRLRLAIVSALAASESLTFKELRQIVNATDGNLSVHARKLEQARFITSRKFFEGRVPRTEYRLTKTGRRALERHLDHMEALIRAMRGR